MSLIFRRLWAGILTPDLTERPDFCWGSDLFETHWRGFFFLVGMGEKGCWVCPRNSERCHFSILAYDRAIRLSLYLGHTQSEFYQGSISGPLESGYVQLLFFVPRKVFECFWMLGQGTPAPGNEQFAVVFVWDLQHLAYGIGTEAFFSLHNGAKWAVCIEYNKQ